MPKIRTAHWRDNIQLSYVARKTTGRGFPPCEPIEVLLLVNFACVLKRTVWVRDERNAPLLFPPLPSSPTPPSSGICNNVVSCSGEYLLYRA